VNFLQLYMEAKNLSDELTTPAGLESGGCLWEAFKTSRCVLCSGTLTNFRSLEQRSPLSSP